MINTVFGALNYLFTQVFELFGYEPFLEIEPTVFKAIFEAIKSIFVG